MLELASAVIISAIVTSFAADVMFRAVTFIAPRRKAASKWRRKK